MYTLVLESSSCNSVILTSEANRTQTMSGTVIARMIRRAGIARIHFLNLIFDLTRNNKNEAKNITAPVLDAGRNTPRIDGKVKAASNHFFYFTFS